jgi:biotin carboxyl carrier protein
VTERDGERRRARRDDAGLEAVEATERTDTGTDRRAPRERLADHAAIDGLSEELLPALVAKLGASDLGEIEVREGGWRIRLRRAIDASARVDGFGRRATDRPSRPQPGHSGHGHAPAAVEGHLAASGRDGHGTLAPVGPGRLDHDGTGAGRSGSHRAVATSPAVGIFQPRPEIRPGSKVRSGDRLGHVDVLGVRQDVVSPVDGIVGATLVEPGDAVEYGQDLVRIEMIGATAPSGADGQA